MGNSGIKIVLANPPTPGGDLVIREGRCEQSGGLWATVWPPLSLATIAAFLERDQHSVTLMDCPVEGKRDTDFVAEIQRIKPQMVLLNVSTPTLSHDLTFPKKIKSVVLDCVVIAIGTHVSALPREVLTSCPDLDIIVMGEPEKSVAELAANIIQDGTVSDVPGTAYLENNELVVNEHRPHLEDLDNLPIPAWHLINLDLYRLPVYKRPFLMISSGRGCPFDCSFCTAQTYYGKKLRLRSPEAVAREMFEVQSKYGVSDFLFWTETFTVNKKQVMEFCDIVKDHTPAIRWTCNSRVDAVDEEVLLQMRNAGCWMVSFGIESSSQAVLDRAGKHIQIKAIHSAVKQAKKAGLQVTGHFILGLPGESQSSLRDTADMAVNLDLDYAQFYCAAPFPGSRLYDEALSEGWIRNPDWNYFDQTHANLDLPELPAEMVMKERQRAIRRFYFRPRQVFRTLRRIRSFSELTNLIRMFMGFIRSLL
jgi:radical SAM superfamily enzyme YgiQ (UPF0313 family)